MFFGIGLDLVLIAELVNSGGLSARKRLIFSPAGVDHLANSPRDRGCLAHARHLYTPTNGPWFCVLGLSYWGRGSAVPPWMAGEIWASVSPFGLVAALSPWSPVASSPPGCYGTDHYAVSASRVRTRCPISWTKMQHLQPNATKGID